MFGTHGPRHFGQGRGSRSTTATKISRSRYGRCRSTRGSTSRALSVPRSCHHFLITASRTVLIAARCRATGTGATRRAVLARRRSVRTQPRRGSSRSGADSRSPRRDADSARGRRGMPCLASRLTGGREQSETVVIGPINSRRVSTISMNVTIDKDRCSMSAGPGPQRPPRPTLARCRTDHRDRDGNRYLQQDRGPMGIEVR